MDVHNVQSHLREQYVKELHLGKHTVALKECSASNWNRKLLLKIDTTWCTGHGNIN